MKKILIALLAFGSLTTFAGNLSIINKASSLINFQVSGDAKFNDAILENLRKCHYVNPYSNFGGSCEGINDFITNKDGLLYIRFISGGHNNSTLTYKLEKGSCYKFIQKSPWYGHDLVKGCNEVTRKGPSRRGQVRNIIIDF